MKVWREEYGADADGNRGVMQTMYELEHTDEEKQEIAEILYDGFVNLSGVTGEENIEYNGIEIEVEIEEYYDELIKMAKEDDNMSSDELKYLLKEVEYYG